jgi:hypothetical protein
LVLVENDECRPQKAAALTNGGNPEILLPNLVYAIAGLGLGGLDLEAVLLGGGREETTHAVGLPISGLLFQQGTLNAINNGVATDGLAHLGSVEGSLFLENGGSHTVTPGSGTLTNPDSFIGGNGTTLTANGSFDNKGFLQTSGVSGSTGNNTLNVSGTFTNEAGATVRVAGGGDSVKINALNNSGTVGLHANIATPGSVSLSGSRQSEQHRLAHGRHADRQ